MELKPCPFCGSECIDLYEGGYGNGVYCMKCGVMMGEPIHLEFRVSERVSMAQAIEAWNTRAERTCENGMPRSYNYLKCSLCGSLAYKGSAEFGYCPNCGAKVVEE